MKALSLDRAIEFYLAKRRQLGFRLKEDGQILRQLARYAAQHKHRGPLTRQVALAWAQAPARASHLWWARRLDTVRRFAIFWSAFDSRTEVPPSGFFGPSYCRRAVHIYTSQQTTALMEAALGLGGIRGLSFHYVIGLLACTGLRIGEALRLREEDIDWLAGLLTVRHSKLGRSRCLPLQASTLEALDTYRCKRRKHVQQGKPVPLFIGRNGKAITYGQAARTFACLRRDLGWNTRPVPRWHDLRHTFAVSCLLDWYRKEDEVAPKVLSLATYLGHSKIQGTYWYLSAVPELLALALARWPELNAKPGGTYV